MKTLSYLWKVIKSPHKGFAELFQNGRVRYAAWFVLSYGILNGLGFVISARDYPPPAATLDMWIKTWGEFTMTPFLKIPMENYRLFLAAIMIPLTLAIWMLMAGTGKLLSLLFKGKAAYEQYLTIVGFGMFTFLWIAAILDTIYSGYLRQYAIPALNMEYGPAAKAFFQWFPPLEYTLLYGLGGIFNGIGTQVAEHWQPWKSVLIGMLTFVWPMVLIMALLR